MFIKIKINNDDNTKFLLQFLRMNIYKPMLNCHYLLLLLLVIDQGFSKELQPPRATEVVLLIVSICTKILEKHVINQFLLKSLKRIKNIPFCPLATWTSSSVSALVSLRIVFNTGTSLLLSSPIFNVRN